MSLGPKVTHPVAHMLYIRLIKGNIKKSSCLKALGLRVNIIFLIIALSSTPLPSFFSNYASWYGGSVVEFLI